MRHRKSGKKFSRTPAHRKAMFRNMATALLTHYSLRTTVVKAKSLRGVVEPLITLAKRNDLHARRQAYKVLGSHQLVKVLFDEIGPLFEGVPGGYTRVIKLSTPRKGDNAPMAVIELIRKPGAEESESAAPMSKEQKDEAVKQAVEAATAAE
ncbi:50S ribosomal protein L17 [Halodesulfovibrio sp.]|uniref:50S ribosomal protein L17 n=1 Tax=Halodesulfovibrio sp. TaxID=1912772 RepID=UPI0025BE877B|nr:50S ribosomal protein L17 [Halodesulfovibrio sp.]